MFNWLRIFFQFSSN